MRQGVGDDLHLCDNVLLAVYNDKCAPGYKIRARQTYHHLDIVPGLFSRPMAFCADNAALKTDVAQQQRGAAVFVQPVDTAQAVKKCLKLNSRLCHSRTPPAIATC